MGLGGPPDARRLRLRLTALAFVMLFVELALIRWLGGNVLYLSYFSNIVLLGSFLGVGLGFLWAGRHDVELLRFTPLTLAALVTFVHLFPVRIEAAGGELIFFGAELRPSGPPRELMLPAVFLASAAVLMCVGDGIARTFRQLANLDAYQFDLIGSLLGIVGFTVLAFLGAQPVVWGSVAAAVLWWAIRPRGHELALVGLPLVALLGVLAVESTEDGVIWTPYYKAQHTAPGPHMWLFVNGTPHWQFVPDGDSPIYQPLYERLGDADLGDVLIIGSGSGNDVAVALANGARNVDAVEIDPRLHQLAETYHPNRPYDDPRVTAHINDGRAFLEQSGRSWDLIVLALPDSLTLVQGASAVRLESFLFTIDAAESYRDHLRPGGAFAMYNLYREDWLVDRYAATLEEAFGHAPCVSRLADSSTAVLTVGAEPDGITCPASDRWLRPAGTPDPVSDDRPFPYLRTVGIPGFYLVALGLILLVSFAGVRLTAGPLRGMARFADLFFLGVAFLLLETKHVVQFALLFGTTWIVNAMVFGGVLLAVLLAVVVSKRVRVPNLAVLYVLLALAVLLSWLVPQKALLGLPFWLRLAAAVVLAFAPIFIANLVFAQRFRDTSDALTAFAANLLGAMVGGVLEYTSLVLGYRNLALVALAAYGMAFLTGRRHLVTSDP